MNITSENFIKHFKKKREDALEYVINEYIGIVKSIIFNSLKSYNDPQIIEECVSDTFLGAFDNEYAGLFIFQLIEGPKPDVVHVTWDGDNVLNLANTEIAYAGDWSFQLTLNALESETQEFVGVGIQSETAGIDIMLTKMTETPVSTTLYLSEQVDVRKVSMEDEEWRGVTMEYLVTDDLGNEYNMIYYWDTGHSTDFQDFEGYLSRPRITTALFHEEATSITITPIVNVYKKLNDDGFLELVKEPYAIESIQFDLNK